MKDLFCSYYTNSKDITSYMVSKLGIVENDVILEPSAGEGIDIVNIALHISLKNFEQQCNGINIHAA